MRIVVTGGGSGGHITPVLVVARELKALQPSTEVIYIGYKGDPLADVPARDSNIDTAYYVRAGKLRRYHGEGVKQLFDLPTLFKNVRDMFLTMAGIWQSLWLLRRLRPDVLFIKGGFVGLPVGLSAAILRIPYVTHDSDALPGLANRLVAPWAKIHAVGLPKEVYSYPSEKTVTVGVPYAKEFHPLKQPEIQELRKQLGLEAFRKVIFVTGGGNGARRLNHAVVACMPDLLARYRDLAVVHVTGRAEKVKVEEQYQRLLSKQERGRAITRGFVTNLYQYSGAADVIITRAGATAMAEFAAQAKACVVVPYPILAGGHQLKNAKAWTDRKAIKMVNEKDLVDDPHALMAPLVDLLDHPEFAQQLGEKLHTMTRPDAAERLAMLLLELGAKRANSAQK